MVVEIQLPEELRPFDDRPEDLEKEENLPDEGERL